MTGSSKTAAKGNGLMLLTLLVSVANLMAGTHATIELGQCEWRF